MEQYIKKSALLAEIERRINNHAGFGYFPFSAYCLEDREILSFINTIEVKGVDLEKELNDYGYHYDYVSLADRKELVDFAKHFFTLGLFSQLTWKDIRLISEIGEDFMNSEESDNLGEEEYYTMILNKLKEKGRDYKTERQITRELEQKGE